MGTIRVPHPVPIAVERNSFENTSVCARGTRSKYYYARAYGMFDKYETCSRVQVVSGRQPKFKIQNRIEIRNRQTASLENLSPYIFTASSLQILDSQHIWHTVYV